MANYDQATGTSGILRMVITQSGPNFTVQFQIINNSAPTNVGSLPWSGNRGGSPRSGAVGISGAGTYTVLSESFTQYGSVPFSFSIPASGTSGLGGPATVSVTLNGGSATSVPGVPPNFDLTVRAPTELTFTWGAAAANGDSVDNYQIQVATDTAFNNQVTAPQFSGSARTGKITGLTQNNTLYSRIRAKNGVGWGAWSARLSTNTQAAGPNPHTVTATTPQTASLAWTKQAGGTAGINNWYWQVSDVAQSGLGDFTSSVNSGSVSGTTFQTLISGLVPGKTYWSHIRARATGGNLWGQWSSVISWTLPAATAPSLVVTPSADGRSATLTATPPPQVTASSYRAQRRLLGTTTATDVNFTGTTTNVSGLTPGATYEWRLSALYTGGQSPYSEWQAVFQPATNTNPGDYFDGSTAAKPDTSYRWTGTVNNSTSEATSFPPLGWRTFGQGNAESGGTGVTVKVTGGIAQTHAARTTFWTPTIAGGFHGGTGLAVGETFDVQAGGTYYGSAYVSPSRPQSMAAEITWLNAARAVIGYSIGTPLLVETNDEEMTRLTVGGLAPGGAAFGAVGWTDVDGDGWSAWDGGDSVIVDAAMSTVGALYPYFDGATPDTTQFDYAWLGAVNASISERTTLDFDAPDPLADPDCPPIPAPPVPPTIEDSCIIPTGEWRRYWAIVSDSEISEWLDLVPTLTLTTAGQPARQIRIRYWENPDGLLPDQFQQTTGWAAEQILSFMPASTVLTIDGVSERVWASVAGGDMLAADKLLYGTGGTPASWPVLSCGIAYLISFDVPLDADVGNLSVDVALTRRM